jgi:hypothetical protein
LAAAAGTLATTCRSLTLDSDVPEITGHRLRVVTESLAGLLEADSDPATFEQTEAVHEVERVIEQVAVFRHRITEEGIPELELVRLEDKRRRMENRDLDVPVLYSQWQETTDLMTRTNLHESARVEELWHLRRIAGRLAAAAHERSMPRAALQALEARLRMLMPREWFHDPNSRQQVLDDICRASIEVEELVLAYPRPAADPSVESQGSAVAAKVTAEGSSRGDPSSTVQLPLREVPRPSSASKSTDIGELDESPAVRFDSIEHAIVLLLRDGKQPRSMREYAKAVGVAHSTLSRNCRWQDAWSAAKAGATKDKDDMPRGRKDDDGNVEAAVFDLCENCRREPIVRTVTVKGELVRLCETCAEKHEPRTNPRTT